MKGGIFWSFDAMVDTDVVVEEVEHIETRLRFLLTRRKHGRGVRPAARFSEFPFPFLLELYFHNPRHITDKI